jgi:2-polyprenyl-6-methoxyphenol hydroxylase-like FAD-dependent oxidoreductase
VPNSGTAEFGGIAVPQGEDGVARQHRSGGPRKGRHEQKRSALLRSAISFVPGGEANVRKAIVCGSGIAGLSAAIALAMKGWSIEVYERSSAVREIGAGIFVKANALRVLEWFGLLDRVRRDCIVLRAARTLNKHGEVLQSRTMPESNPVWNIQRQLLIRALLERAMELGARVHTGSAVDAVSPDGTVRIHGHELRADLVVAADGVNSVARHALGLDRPVRAPLSGAIRLLVPRTACEAEDIVRESWSGRLRVGVSPCTQGEAFVYCIAPLSEPRGARVPIDVAYWSASFPKLASEGLFERAAQAEASHHRYPFVQALAWGKGRVALVGDAAHALPPTLGQGAGLSLMNTLLLSEYLSRDADVPTALAAWEREWRWVSDRTQIWSRRYDWVTSEWPRSAYALRDAVIWGIGKSPRFNGYMRVADRVDAPRRTVLPLAAVGARPSTRARDDQARH